MKLEDHFLLGDEVVGLVEKVHEAVQLVRPVVQYFSWIFGALEINHAQQPVNQIAVLFEVYGNDNLSGI